MKCLLVFACFFGTTFAVCSRKPDVSVTRFPKSPGDNGFKIIVNGDPERYLPGTFYTVTLVGSRTHNRLQQFTRFSLAADPRDTKVRSTPLTHGQFQLFADTISTFDEECVNVVKEADDLPKTEVQVMWKAPKAGSGCVVIKAMVFESPRKWFAEDGQLSRQICEQTSRDAQIANKDCCSCDEAKYNMVFEGLWSNVTHPKDFPISLWLTHFSDIIGASHEKNFTFWGEGQIASDGFRSLAEWGSTRLMEEELLRLSKHLKTIIKSPGLWYPDVNNNASATFKVDQRRHLVSLASMFGPTPDWVVGVSQLNLCLKDCTWVKDLTIDLYPWDAGTDSGITYMSPNSETKPREKMFRITTKYPEDPRAPFYDPSQNEMNPLARLYLTRESIIPKNCGDTLLEALVQETVEHTDDTARPECGVTEYGAWSPCSVTCGKGLRMRRREYTMPMEKVKMFGCNRQLVSKEMCVSEIPECDSDTNSKTEDLISESNDETSAMCATTEWGPWSQCSATCGVGFNMKIRNFLDNSARKKCQVPLVEKQKCMMPECLPEHIDTSCPVTPWSHWSPCSASCGQGVRMRMRILQAPAELQEECSQSVELVQQSSCTDIPSCNLDMATAKKICMEPVVPGICRGSYERWAFNAQKMMCIPFTYNGCRGNRNNFMTEQDCANTCNVLREAATGIASAGDRQSEIQSPIVASAPSVTPTTTASSILTSRQDCVLSEWSEWSPCSVTCGYGYAEKFRMIKAEAMNGGIPCPFRLNKRRRCFNRQC